VKRLQPVTLLLAAMLFAGGTNIARANDETAAMKELVPTGKLRAGIVYAPALSAFFAVKDADGRPAWRYRRSRQRARAAARRCA
jgi:hypothetical protein